MSAQIQVADELRTADFIIEENTLHSDGTLKKGHSYLTYDIKINDGTVLVAGWRSVGGGDAQTQLNTLKEVVKDLGESVGDDNHFVKKVFSSIKNFMSDRCATPKKFHKIFTEFRCSVVPDIVSNWDTLTLEHQQKMKTVNDFYCGLHFLVALGDQAEASLKSGKICYFMTFPRLDH